MKRLASVLATAGLVFSAMVLASRDAHGDESVIRTPGAHPNYRFEGELHGDWGWFNYGYAGGEGIGIGGRFSLSVLNNGFIPTINNSVAVTFGLDYLHYAGPGGCYTLVDGNCFGAGAAANYIFLPVAMQWNFYLTRHWSVFGEPGLAIYHLFFDNPCNGVADCHGYVPTTTSITPVVYAGGRYHFNDHLALVLRIGYPTVTFGVSFM